MNLSQLIAELESIREDYALSDEMPIRFQGGQGLPQSVTVERLGRFMEIVITTGRY